MLTVKIVTILQQASDKFYETWISTSGNCAPKWITYMYNY